MLYLSVTWYVQCYSRAFKAYYYEGLTNINYYRKNISHAGHTACCSLDSITNWIQLTFH